MKHKESLRVEEISQKLDRQWMYWVSSVIKYVYSIFSTKTFYYYLLYVLIFSLKAFYLSPSLCSTQYIDIEISLI